VNTLSITHVAVRVGDLREAERFYTRLFGLAVAFREAETPDGWATLPDGNGWEEAEAAGISLSMCLLFRNGFRLALGQGRVIDGSGVLDHVGLLVEPAELALLRERALELHTTISVARDTLVVLDDPYGVRWEITTLWRNDPRSDSSGASRGLWLDLSPTPERD
jgi:catechol 2,3-dioxygenase-like lactoylglutathione lyase family enzyme